MARPVLARRGDCPNTSSVWRDPVIDAELLGLARPKTAVAILAILPGRLKLASEPSVWLIIARIKTEYAWF
jgi:hypothetical protein